jgi:hypothetical protein
MPGLRTPTAGTSALVLGLAVACALVFEPAVVAQEPDIELLEYLGSWQTDEGSVVDPFQLDEAKDLEPELEQTDVKTGGHTQRSLEDRLNEERRVRKPEPASSAKKVPERRDVSPGGGHE